MKIQNLANVVAVVAIGCCLVSCNASHRGTGANPSNLPPVSGGGGLAQNAAAPAQLPSRYQNPGYLTSQAAYEDDLGVGAGGAAYQVRVGATIKSTTGPQPLWDVLKRLANLKGMTVSWASDVDQNRLVDVDINAQDSFQDAVNNLLRQVDYFHEMEGRSIVVKNKTTKVFHIGLPDLAAKYTTNVGGNFLPDPPKQAGGSSLKTKAEVALESKPGSKPGRNSDYDLWANISENLDVILNIARQEGASLEASKAQAIARDEAKRAAEAAEKGEDPKKVQQALADVNAKSATNVQRAEDGGFYIIDRTTGTVTVTAKPSVMATIENYFTNLKKHLFRQIAIDAKVIEVYLDDHSKVGLDWNAVINGLSVPGRIQFGRGNNVYQRTGAVGRFVNTLSLLPTEFNVLINALNEQGETHVLANPKLTVMNGQGAILSIGRLQTYIASVERETTTGTLANEVTITATPDTVVDGISMGVVATIADDQKIVLQLTPVTTELENGDVPYRQFGPNGELEIGLPVINMREMSTTVQVNDGEMLVIGGLIDTTESKSDRSVPILGKIPVIKYLFGVEEKRIRRRELVVLLSPKII